MRLQWTAMAVAFLATPTLTTTFALGQFGSPEAIQSLEPSFEAGEIGTGIDVGPPEEPVQPQYLDVDGSAIEAEPSLTEPTQLQPTQLQPTQADPRPIEIQPMPLEVVQDQVKRAEITPVTPKEVESRRQSPATGDYEMETIVERYEDGNVKVQRTVIRDAKDNYLNHGNWKWLDRKGEVISEGEYEFGNRVGRWVRWMAPNQAKIFEEAPYQAFEPPFLSETTFSNGTMDGEWNIYDSRERKISQIIIEKGERNGNATWWYPNGQVMRRIPFRSGVIDGTLEVWDASGKPIAREVYNAGQQISLETKEYRPGQKQSEVTILNPRIVIARPDVWWDAEFAEFKKEGEPLRNGELTQWHANGKKMRTARYEKDSPVGLAIWWYDNGQKSLEGEFDQGEQTGRWTWWHRNGMKATEGAYDLGQPTGEWIWWDQHGRVTRRSDMTPKTQPQEVTELESVSPRTTLLPPELK
jgi:antitoxin component YwqK of YwqJK toxin-antitoxin module